MTCQILFSNTNKKYVSKCLLLKFLPTMQSVSCHTERDLYAFTNSKGPDQSQYRVLIKRVCGR